LPLAICRVRRLRAIKDGHGDAVPLHWIDRVQLITLEKR